MTNLISQSYEAKKLEEAKEKRLSNFNSNLYKNDGYEKIALRIINEEMSVKLTTEQERYLSEMFSRMDTVTIVHSLKATALGEAFIEEYNSKGKNFEADFGISENDFKLGLLIHDSGKISMSKELILSNKKYTDLDYEEMKAHSLEALDTIKLINEQANPGMKLSEVFDSSVTTIAINHHPSYLDDHKAKQCKTYCKLAAEIDSIEAMSDKDRLYKVAMDKEDIIPDVKTKIIDKYFPEPEQSDKYYTQKLSEKSKMDFMIDNYDDVFSRFSKCEKIIDKDFELILASNKILAENYNYQYEREQSLNAQIKLELFENQSINVIDDLDESNESNKISIAND